MIQDIAPYRYRNEYSQQEPKDTDYVMCFREGNALVKYAETGIAFPTFAEVQEINPEVYKHARYLFAIDEMKFFLVELKCIPTGFKWMPKVQFRYVTPAHFAFAGITAYQLDQWYQSHRFCGRCGAGMKHSEKERMVYCEECHQMEYPKISPAVIIGVTDGNRLLLTKYANRAHKNYALVAGFAEIGETIEETVQREVMEEVGLKVKRVTYYKSQPWSFTDTLLFGFYAEVDGACDLVVDREELACAEWFEREKIPVNERTVSLTNEMILQFKHGRDEEQE